MTAENQPISIPEDPSEGSTQIPFNPQLVSSDTSGWSGARLYGYTLSPLAPRAMIVRDDPRTAECRRQMERLKWVREAGDDADPNYGRLLESIQSSQDLLCHIVALPLPVPIASNGEEGCTSLFFDFDGLYGDVEVNGNRVEYYLKSANLPGTGEVIGEEEIADNRIPPNLLIHLFAHYAATLP